jgi:molybdenum cofactor biosynthesis enzyme MoaA
MHPEIESILSLPRQFSSLGYVLSTNGTVRGELDSAIVDNRWLVAVSLHGGEETHNSYTNSRSWKRVVKRIASLAQSTNVHIYSVVHERMNISDVDWLLRFQAENGVKFLRFIAPRNFGRYENSCNTDLYEYVNSLEGASIGFKTSSSNTRFLPVSGVPRMSN